MESSEEIKEYFEVVENEVNRALKFANDAKSNSYDPDDKVDILITKDMIERVEGLVSTVCPQIKGSGVVERLRELEKIHGAQSWKVAFIISLEISQEKFCKFKDKKEAMEVGMRVGLAYITNGVVASPMEGFTNLGIKKRRDGGEYFSLYFAGPIRSAGTTATCVFVALCDYVRRNMGYSTYDPSEEEIKRTATELYDFHERITNLQYLPTEEEIVFMTKNLPLQIDGPASETLEVSNYKDLSRIETNFLRNGVCLVMGEGLTQKAAKFWSKFSVWNKEFDMEDWSFLDNFVKLQKSLRAKDKAGDETQKVKPDYGFIKDIVAGRPVFTFPLAKGGFRLRYGRCRNSGFSGQAISPVTMAILDGFIAIGTQLKVERPGKSTVIASCDEIEGPIVKLKGGEVLFLESVNEAKKITNEIEEILYLGDLLINYGDFLDRGHILLPVGYCEEWWGLETGEEKTKIDVNEAIRLCRERKVPLHPRYTFHWKGINKEQFNSLLNLLRKGVITEEKIVLPYIYDVGVDIDDNDPKRALELLGITHRVVLKEHVVIEGEWSKALLFSIGNKFEYNGNKEEVLEIVNEMSGVLIRDKSGTTIGCRMGRPEKAKMRKLTGSPQVLFPVGKEGGRLRCFQDALDAGKINAEFPLRRCNKCNVDTIYERCEMCGQKTESLWYCRICKRDGNLKCHDVCIPYKNTSLDIQHYFNVALKTLETNQYPELIKGVRGVSNEGHIPENLCKGILRAKYGLYVNKDGTIRYDMTEMPITHFKPLEIVVGVSKLREMGYKKDIFGNELVSENQILEIKPQDVILPACPDTLDEACDEVMMRICNFIDELLVKVYKKEKYYNLKSKEDLIGHLVISLSPHTSAGVVGRIIGFSKTQGMLAHPSFHCVMRRDCVFPDTKFVYSDKNEKIYYEEIGPFVDSLIRKGARTRVVDAVGTIQIDFDEKLFAYGADPETKEIKKKKIKHFVKGPLTKEWISITTSTNRVYTVTLNHDFMYLDEKNKLKFKKAKEVKVDDRVLVLDKFEPVINFSGELNLVKEFIDKLPFELLSKIKIENCRAGFKDFVKRIGKSRLINILEFKKGFRKSLSGWYKGVPLSDFKKLAEENLISIYELPKEAKIRTLFGHYQFNHKIKIDENLGSLLGYYTSEGHLHTNKTTNQVSFRNSKKDIQEKITRCIKTCFGIEPILEEENTKIIICHKLVYWLFKYCFKCGNNAHTKRVPQFIYNAPDEIARAYISAYTDGDGTITLERKIISFSSVSKSLLDDLAFLLTRFNLIGRFFKNKPRLHGRTAIEGYKFLGKEPKLTVLYNLNYGGKDAQMLAAILDLKHDLKNDEAKEILALRQINKRALHYNHKQIDLYSFGDAFVDYVKKAEIIKEEANSYCLEVEWKEKEERNVVWGNQIINTRCDGDEAGIMMLMDSFLNFSTKYLPSHRGARQDEPLVLSFKLIPSEVDDMVYNLDVVWKYPLELYQAGLEYKDPKEVNIDTMRKFLGKERQYEGFGFTHGTQDINNGILCSSYKSIPTMLEKVEKQMGVAEKIRAVNENEVAALIIGRHFMRDIRGNLRRFTMQSFRCVKCNEKYRRPPLFGKCLKCEGRLIFTVSEGTVTKYLEASFVLAEKYDLPPYLKQSLELVKVMIESVMGKDNEKQEGLVKWFGK